MVPLNRRRQHIKRNPIIIIILHFIYIGLFNDPKTLTGMKSQKDNKITQRQAMTVRGDKRGGGGEVGGLDNGADMGIKREGGVKDNAEIVCR